MDIYTAITEILVELLALSHGLLNLLVVVPANASGPLDPAAGLTEAGSRLASDTAAAALNAGNILCDMFEALF